MRRGFVRELRAVSGESLTRVRLIGPYHRTFGRLRRLVSLRLYSVPPLGAACA